MRSNRKIVALLLMFALSLGYMQLAAAQDIPPGVTRNLVPYGTHPLQRFDVYVPTTKHPATTPSPIFFYVHGGGWDSGDKLARQMYYNKAARWVPRDFVFVSINYRLMSPNNGITPLDQAQDVARALAEVQRLAPSWRANPDKVILMGHSAGAHLITLFASEPIGNWAYTLKPWLGTVSLDGAALNLVEVMSNPHPAYFDAAFGNNPLFWRAASPFHQLEGPTKPWLGVCSTIRPFYVPNSCYYADKYATEAERLGSPYAEDQPEELTHEQVNDSLGLENDYTRRVETFLRTLDPEVSKRLPQFAIGQF